MANDELIFKIGFDLEAGVEEAMKDGNLALGRIEKALAKNPIIVKMRLDQQERLSGQVKSESKKAASALSGLKKEMAELNRQWNTLTASERGGEAGAKLMAQYRALSEEAKGYMTTLNAAVKLEDKLARQREKSADAAQKAAQKTREYSDGLKNQDGYVSRLLKRMAVYAGYSMATNFLTSVRDVTAEFELQRVSLGAIIQDQQKANQIFSEIKSFALTSPLKILDLTKYTKQVAAYGFETEKLFDTTKMLADISVGLGTDMSRASLFLGQVFATGHLRASELRQATEMGIPLVAKLADKLEELNGKAYSAADVMDLISKRAIGYDLVEQVFKDMTSAGGEFYNMQVKQSQTLYGMWSKLGDAAAIMYDQIGNTSTVNAGMKTIMGLLESMMRNWKTTARVLDTVSVALAVYVIGLKNAAVASTAMTATEAARLAITNKQTFATPKLIASIIGQNAATKLSTNLTRAHTVAMLNQSAATNVLTRGFWKLTAAMLANPWVAAAAAIAAVGVALFHFIGNTETAAERAEKLNNSVASLKSLTTEVEPLIDTHKELADKTERTADEQKKLNEVAKELAQKFPAAITVIKEYGQEMGLAADEVARLYENMKRMKTEDVQQELTENESAVNKLIQRRQQLQKYFDEGKMWVGGGGTGGGGGAMVAMSEEERTRVTTLITDIDKQILELNESIINAKRELGELPSETTQAIEGFGAWKKKLTEFNKDVGGMKIRLFDDSTINQFGTLEEALDAAAKKYEEAAESVETYNKTLEQGVDKLGKDQFDKISAERDEAQAMKELSEEALNYYNAMALLLKVMGGGRGSQSDPRLQNLKEEISLVQKLYDEYKQLEKQEGATKAAEDMRRMAGSTLDMFKEKYNIDLPTDAEDLTAALEILYAKMAQLPKKVFPTLDKDLKELRWTIEKVNIDESQKNIESELKRLADRISRTKTAKEFYEKILSQTGNANLAGRLATSIFGEQGDALNKEIAEWLRNMVEATSATLPDFVFNADMSVNTKALRGWVESNKTALGDVAKELTKFADESGKDTAKMVEGWLKATEKAKTYGDKLADVYRTTATEISRIEAEMAKGSISQSDGMEIIADYRRKEAEEIAKLQYEAFKDSPLYVEMFDDLYNASTRMLKNMKARLLDMQDAWRNLDPSQLKEMQSRLREIDTQLTKRNPFKAFADGMREYYNLRTKGDSRGNKSRKDADSDVQRWTESYLKAEQELAKLKSDPAATEAQLAGAAQMVTWTKRQKEEAEKTAVNWQKVEDAIGLSANELFQMLNWAGDIAKSIADISEAMGADEDDVQYWNDVADALGQISGGIQDIVSAAMSGNVVGIISSTLTAIPKMFVGFTNLFSAGKVRRANKEIKRQQELLDQLEYTYGRLEKAADKVFGADVVSNYNQQLKVLQAQATAYQRQAEAERSKGKKKDKAKIKEYENAYRDTMDAIADMQRDLSARFYGTDLTSAARDFASAWLDAYKEFGNTADVMSDKFHDMIQNMIVESLLAKVMEQALKPAFDLIDQMDAGDFYSPDFWKRVSQTAAESIAAADQGASIMMNFLNQAGISMRDLGSDLTGISRDIASASEESINGLAAGINTQNFYISQQLTEVRLIRQLLENGASLPAGNSEGIDILSLHNTAMTHLQSISQHTAETVTECRLIAARCQEQVDMLRRVIVPRGTPASHGIQVWMK